MIRGSNEVSATFTHSSHVRVVLSIILERLHNFHVLVLEKRTVEGHRGKFAFERVSTEMSENSTLSDPS